MDSEFDVGGPVKATGPLLAKVKEAAALNELIQRQEEDLKQAKAALHKLSTKVIPDMMVEALPGVTELKQDGWNIKLSDFFSGSLPKEPEPLAKAIAWLDFHDQGGMIKTKITLSIPRAHREKVGAIEAVIKKAIGNLPIEVEVSETVHSQTLIAFAREAVRKGEPINLETLGIFSGRVVKFKKVG